MSSNDERGRTPGRDAEVEGHAAKFKGAVPEDEFVRHVLEAAGVGA